MLVIWYQWIKDKLLDKCVNNSSLEVLFLLKKKLKIFKIDWCIKEYINLLKLVLLMDLINNCLRLLLSLG